ncbi:MAG: UvrD-helicase domain-containing protein [Candidatus Omnitrophota bacterium]
MKLEFPHIFVYEASAGSGKTRKLAERYVDFLLRYSDKAPAPFNFRNLIAVTFTNEAADQMRQEILKMLKAKSLAPLEKSFKKGSGKQSESSRAMQIVDEIIQNYSDFAVRTIDSFVHSLLIASSLELKLPPDYEIISQPRPYLEYVLDDFLDQIITDPETSGLFEGFLNHFLIVEGQRHWSPKKLLLSLLIRFYREENGRAKLFQDIAADADLIREESDLKEQLRRFVSSLNERAKISRSFTKGISSCLENSGPDFLKSFNRYAYKSLEPGKGVILKNAGGGPDADLVRQWNKLNRQFNNYAHEFVWLRYNFYLKVFSPFRQRFEDFKERKRIVFLDELNKKARQFLTSEGLIPAEIYYKLSLVLYHYLIDEFQDTSILQWENIQALVEDALSKGGSLFYVGDKKQAIYRFRGGEVELFDLIKARFSNRVAKIYDEVLLSNYRSQRIIVDFNNSVFSQENLGRFLTDATELTGEYRQKILDVFRDSQQKPAGQGRQGGYVRIEVISGDNKQQTREGLDASLKQNILQLRERFNYRDILILVRNNQDAQRLACFLLEQGFPVCAARTVSIRQNYVIRQIISLLKFLNSPIDNLCFADFILSDIFARATQLNPGEIQFWLENSRVNEEEGVLYTRFRSAYPAVWEEFLHYLFNAVGFLPVYDLAETILIKFKIEENFPELTGFTRRLLEILNDLQEQGKNSLPDFLDWFEDAEEEELFVQLPLGLDAVNILTIHKAKGLSSPVVILPYAALEVKVGEAAFEAPKIVHETPEGLYLLYLQKEICQKHSKLASIYQREYFQAFLDELNCLYVGLTRAASELYIYLSGKINRRINPSISLLLGRQQDKNLLEFGKRLASTPRLKISAEESQKKIKPAGTLPQELFKSILKDQLMPAGKILSAKRRFLAKRGDVLHCLLAQIPPLDFLKDTSSYIQNIRDACRLFNYPYSGEIIRQLIDFFGDSKMQSFFNPEFKFFNEKEIADRRGNLNRIDRLVFAKDKIMVIDYKTGEEYQQQHQDQIREYAGLIKEIYPDRLCEGWLIYFDTKDARLVNLP